MDSLKTTTVQGLLDGLNDFAPFALAAKWDNVGLMVGHPKAKVEKILIGLDPCMALFEEAVARGVTTVISHHPLIFQPLKRIDIATVAGRLVAFAITKQLNIIGCHTNFDQIAGGISDLLARALGVETGVPLQPAQGDAGCGFGWIGDLATPLAGDAFLHLVAQKLAQPDLLVAGLVPERVCRVAVCGGSCGDFAMAAQDQGADVFITSEIKHSQARWAEDAGMCLVDGGHFSTENMSLVGLQEYLAESMGLADVYLSQRQGRPLRGYLEIIGKREIKK